jgi:hypothetical protein
MTSSGALRLAPSKKCGRIGSGDAMTIGPPGRSRPA